jgi:hypothetical protein
MISNSTIWRLISQLRIEVEFGSDVVVSREERSMAKVSKAFDLLLGLQRRQQDRRNGNVVHVVRSSSNNNGDDERAWIWHRTMDVAFEMRLAGNETLADRFESLVEQYLNMKR